MGRFLLIAVACLLLLMLSACGYGEEAAPYKTPPNAIVGEPEGARLYASECAWCHGAQGQGTQYGPNLNGELDGGAYTHFMVSSGRMPLATPQTRAERSTPLFTDAQIDAIVAHVETFGGTGPPRAHPDLTDASPQRGSELFLANCAACHSSTGAGGAMTSGEVAPRLDNPDILPSQIAEAMLVGPGCRNDDPVCGPGSGAMPRFDQFSEEQANDVIAYVQTLQDGENPGGWSIGRIGPVAEGAVAWLIGLTALVFVSRWIGTRVGEGK